MAHPGHDRNVRVIGFDHLVLTVADVERALEWYCGFLGMEPVRVDEWRAGQVLFPSARVNATTIIDFFPVPVHADDGAGVHADGGTKNLDHLCLVVEPADLSALGEPGTRFGAQGEGTSVYLKDPDGNTVELRYYGSPPA